MLAVCDREMRFSYVLPGWEGSTSDAWILRDVVGRTNGLKVPIGNTITHLFLASLVLHTEHN